MIRCTQWSRSARSRVDRRRDGAPTPVRRLPLICTVATDHDAAGRLPVHSLQSRGWFFLRAFGTYSVQSRIRLSGWFGRSARRINQRRVRSVSRLIQEHRAKRCPARAEPEVHAGRTVYKAKVTRSNMYMLRVTIKPVKKHSNYQKIQKKAKGNVLGALPAYELGR